MTDVLRRLRDGSGANTRPVALRLLFCVSEDRLDFIFSVRILLTHRRVIVRKNKITISSADRFRLFNLIDSARLDRRVPAEHLHALEGELARDRWSSLTNCRLT